MTNTPLVNLETDRRALVIMMLDILKTRLQNTSDPINKLDCEQRIHYYESALRTIEAMSHDD